MSRTDQSDVDARIQTYYEDTFDESSRLTTRSVQGPLEFQRTQELILEYAPLGRVIDIGGGSGVHAKALRDHGYDVELIDPVRRHVDEARAGGLAAHLGDARDLPFASETFDAAFCSDRSITCLLPQIADWCSERLTVCSSQAAYLSLRRFRDMSRSEVCR